MKLPTMNEMIDMKNEMGSLMFIEYRYKYTENKCFPLITEDVANELTEFIGDRKVLEVAAGSGYLARVLRDNGINIIATDNNSWKNNKNTKYYDTTYVDIEELDAVAAIEKYQNEIDLILLSWPPYNEPLAYDVLRKAESTPIIFIGEDWGGCTGDDAFFELIESEYNMERICHSYEPFYGLHDDIYLIKKK